MLSNRVQAMQESREQLRKVKKVKNTFPIPKI